MIINCYYIHHLYENKSEANVTETVSPGAAIGHLPRIGKPYYLKFQGIPRKP